MVFCFGSFKPKSLMTTVMDGSLNHRKWKCITANVAYYSASCVLIYFTDIYPGCAPQKFQASPCTFTWGRRKTALRPTFEPKRVNESHGKKCYKCVYFVQLYPFFVLHNILACWEDAGNLIYVLKLCWTQRQWNFVRGQLPPPFVQIWPSRKGAKTKKCLLHHVS